MPSPAANAADHTPSLFSRHKASPLALLTPAQVRVVDKASAEAGVGTDILMGRAGAAIAREVMARWPRRSVTVFCGPGNNGGDGLVAAAELKLAGWPVKVALLGEKEKMKGDAAAALRRWNGPLMPASPDALEGSDLVIDALFGIGLTRNVGVQLENLFAMIEAKGLPVVAVDMPSGIDGNTGAIRGRALKASLTIALARKKPGHLLLPGRAYCGELVVADLGIHAYAYELIQPNLFENGPALWQAHLPRPNWESHKYSRGVAHIAGSGTMTGAARLAARAAQRAGAGMVRLIVPAKAEGVYATALSSAIIVPCKTTGDYITTLEDKHISAALIGPGYGTGPTTKSHVLETLWRKLPTVLDADAISAFAKNPTELFAHLGPEVVLTPHEGEFARLFTHSGDAVRRATLAARTTGCIIVLKGASTVIAAPEGFAIVNANAPADLATAGAGDVLSGLITGLLAQGMPPVLAAAAGVWLHGEAARRFGPGLIAEDIEGQIPALLKDLRP